MEAKRPDVQKSKLCTWRKESIYGEMKCWGEYFYFRELVQIGGLENQ